VQEDAPALGVEQPAGRVDDLREERAEVERVRQGTGDVEEALEVFGPEQRGLRYDTRFL
jgi:hypothetical protein